MALRWLALYTGEDTHPRLFDSLERALAYLERFERLPEEVLDGFALRVMGSGEALADLPEVRQRYRLVYVDLLRVPSPEAGAPSARAE